MADFNFKVSPFGFMDMLKFKQIVPLRRKKLAEGENTPLTGSFPVNKLAEYLHPKRQTLRIREVREYPGAGAKGYVLEGEQLAPFRAGQYLPVELSIDGSVLHRAYALCSSPSDAAKGRYELGIKRTKDGFASAWILDHWKPGDQITAAGPEGQFTYEPLRDEAHVVGIAGGSGITPLLSMARAIADGTEEFSLTILYGCRSEEQILFREELEAAAAASGRVKVVYILSDEERPGYEHGFITAALIQKYAPNAPHSVFCCGPEAMYRFVGAECETLGLDKKHVRCEAVPAPACPAALSGYTGDVSAEYSLPGEERCVPMKGAESVLAAIERAGIRANTKCRAGECGFCRAKLLSGEYFAPQAFEHRRAADVARGYIHPCSSYPLSDMTLLLWTEGGAV